MSKKHLISKAAQSLASASQIRASGKIKEVPGWGQTLDAYDTCSATEFKTGKKPVPSRPHKRSRKHAEPKPHNKHLSESYYAHIYSDRWKEFRHEIIMERGKKCERCGKAGRIELHHLHYRNFDHELPEDVKLLCVPCHHKADSGRNRR